MLRQQAPSANGGHRPHTVSSIDSRDSWQANVLFMRGTARAGNVLQSANGVLELFAVAVVNRRLEPT